MERRRSKSEGKSRGDRSAAGRDFPFSVDQLDTPALLIDVEIVDRNIRDMQALANRCGIALRPHIKTHKSPFIAARQIEAGAIGIASAKLSEAEVMASHGIDDIQIANQIVAAPKIKRLLKLARTCRISCAVDSEDNVRDLSRWCESSGMQLDVLIEVDTGLHRSGLATLEDIVNLAKSIGTLAGLRMAGLMTHAGHVYGASSLDKIKAIGRHEGEFMVRAAEAVRSAGVPVSVVSVGSTPTAPYVAEVQGITELRVGNYVFNDSIQVALGTVPPERCALTVLTTVISTPAADRAVIDAGSKVFTSDAGAHGRSLVRGFGGLVGRQGTLERLSEEHGIITFTEGERFVLGERLRVIPNHACATVNMFESAYLIKSNRVVDMIDIEARGCVT